MTPMFLDNGLMNRRIQSWATPNRTVVPHAQVNLAASANTYSHVLTDGTEPDYGAVVQ